MLVDNPEQQLAPQSVQAIIAARLDGLSAENKLVLQDAAVIGRVVWPGALARIEDRSYRFVDRQLHELVRKEFLTRVDPSSVAGEPEFRFRHILVRDVAYEQIPRARRAEIHRATAEWLESLSPDRTADRAEMLALHYLSAYEHVRAAGGETSELAEGARVALRNAGDRALALNAFAAAERHYRAALDLWARDDAGRPSLLFHLGKARYYADTEGADVLTDAEHMLLEAGDIESAAEAATYLAMLAHQRGERQDRVFEHAYRATALVEGRPASRSRAYVLLDLAGFLGLAAEHERAMELAEQALRDAEELDLPELEALALATMGISRGLTGDLGGRRDLERAIAISEAIDSALGSHLCGMLAELERVLGNLDRCFELQAQARRHAERFGHASHIKWLKAEQVAECWWTGRWDEALAHAEEVVGETEAGSGHFMEGYCRVMRGRIRLARSDINGASEDSLRALDHARHSNEPQTLYPALAFRSLVLATSAARPSAARLVDELLEEWRRKLNHVPASAWVVDLACALELLGRESELVEAAADVTNRSDWLEAAVAFSSHEFTGAAEVFARIGSRPDEALARLRAAESLATSETNGDARTQLDRALAFYREVGAETYVAEAETVSVA
jgi:tetratricopeptide (TPR) repeat protein